MHSRTPRSVLIASAATMALALGSASSFAAMNDAGSAPSTTEKTQSSADAYRKRMAGEVDEWKQKVDDFSTKAKEKGTAASKSAATKLDRAWDNVKTQWDKLQNATDDTWSDTKAAFEKAWRDFQDTWKSTTSNT